METRDFTNGEIEEFLHLWKQETGQEISSAQAEEYARELVGLVESIAARGRDQPPLHD